MTYEEFNIEFSKNSEIQLTDTRLVIKAFIKTLTNGLMNDNVVKITNLGKFRLTDSKKLEFEVDKRLKLKLKFNLKDTE